MGLNKEKTSLTARCGAPVGIRTLDLLIRSQTLYPAELRAHVVSRLHYDTSEIFKSQPRETILIAGCVLSGSRNAAGLFHLEVLGIEYAL